MLEEFLKKTGRMDIVLSLIFVVFGIVLILRPEFIVSFIAIILGIFVIVLGILKLYEYFTSDKTNRYLLSIGVIAIISGIVIMCYSDVISSIFRILIAMWIIYSGIMDLQTLAVWKDYKSRLWIFSLLLTIAMIIGGIFILVNSGAILQTIGIIIIAYGVMNIVENVIFIKKVDNYLE